MEVINLSKKEFGNLKPLELPKSVFNTEAKMYEFERRRKQYVLKRLYNDGGPTFANKLYTLEMLSTNRDFIPDSFILPENLVSVNQKVVGFTTPLMPGDNLQEILNSPNIDRKEKIYYLKRIGEILENIKNVRRYTRLTDFYINDLHESNFLVNGQKKQLYVVDTDSCKIANNSVFCSRYLSPLSLFGQANTKKYSIINTFSVGGYVMPNENSDLYCYSIIVLNFLYGTNVNNMNLSEYYTYLTYLSEIGIDKELIDIFANLLTAKQNQNPYHLLDTLSYEQIGKASRNVFSLKMN